MNSGPSSPKPPLHPLIRGYETVLGMYQLLAHKDQLTGLDNKATWQLDVERRIAAGQPFGAIFMDLDSFKQVNDKISHDAGDQLLQRLGNHLRGSFKREGDVLTNLGQSSTLVSRWAGDEFALTFDLTDNTRRGVVTNDAGEPVLDRVTQEPIHKSPEERLEDQKKFFQLVVDEFVESLPEEIKTLGVNVSFSCVLWDPKNPKTAEDFFSSLDNQMYAHKQQRNNEKHHALPRRKRAAAWAAGKLAAYSGVKPQR